MHFIKLSIFLTFIINTDLCRKNVNYETKLTATQEKKNPLLNCIEKWQKKMDIFHFIEKKERFLKAQNKMKKMTIVLFQAIIQENQQLKQIVISMNHSIVAIAEKGFGFKN